MDQSLDSRLTDQIFDLASDILSAGPKDEFELENKIRRCLPNMSSNAVGIYLKNIVNMGFLKYGDRKYFLVE